tara:strand:- start:384 stop:644 length:261 start_codon:yes stop_codon:yes gene_type:complete
MTIPLMKKELKEREELLDEIWVLAGLPTLAYDEYRLQLEERVLDIERSMVKTCEGCGGEIIPDEFDELHYEPENGLCANELDSCND